ncbi:hypothetical protein IMZ31_20320 (plasmid) [Pontibacillus sp. ALD_SL1]|uniref:hypothetical protein n=1 Tax=Pontibacillus sp. ALD_SL1 TaxID=2777185 RepID=UPI001A972ED6|nr:hypothetical protein [Pontibacillus sp. ALD_SL1]QST02896.1 hypothetical protein IMZ31_20320 [Pontibacillus sp. ALD_SL1]
MDLQNFLTQLSQAHEDSDRTEKTQKTIEQQLLKEEGPLVRRFAEHLFPLEKTITVHGEDAVLIYVFDSNGKTMISPEVFLCENGNIVYEVYDEEGYRRFRPTADIQENYVTIPLEEFLMYCPFYEIIAFFHDRIDILYKNAESWIERNDKRKRCIEKMREIL